MTIRKDRVVTIDYSLKDGEGELIDSSEGSDPLVYLHGNENIIPGLERHLDGKNPGDSLDCVVPANEGYGERDEALVFKVDRKDFGPETDVSVGMQFHARSENGTQVVTIVGIDGGSVTVDANHPLAGEELHFSVKVVDVREATGEELEHGHIRSGCGCGCGDECGDDACGCDCGDGCCDDCGEEGECDDGHGGCGCGCGDS